LGNGDALALDLRCANVGDTVRTHRGALRAAVPSSRSASACGASWCSWARSCGCP